MRVNRGDPRHDVAGEQAGALFLAQRLHHRGQPFSSGQGANRRQ
jgi:hypothetical protein